MEAQEHRKFPALPWLAVFAAMEGEANLNHQWPLNLTGKNSEYVARRMNGSG